MKVGRHLKAAASLGKPEGLRPSPSRVEGERPTETLRTDEKGSGPMLPDAAHVVLPEALLTVREVAERLGVCRASVYAMVERGDIPHVRVGTRVRIRTADLAVYVVHGA